MKNKLLLIALSFFAFNFMFAQTYNNHFGNGNNVGVKISSSSVDTVNTAQNTLNGTGYFPDEAGAARFLKQATFGADYAEIQNITNLGIENYIDQQIQMAPLSFENKYDTIYEDVSNIVGVTNIIERDEYLGYTFYSMLLKQQDQLRQKVAFALSQIFVVSTAHPGLQNESKMNASYYDILYKGAFGNFKDILFDVSMHPAMAIYLSHYQNTKADLATGVFPDENYAREIMQLFTIGLFELNNDGTRKKDVNGNDIETYNITDIQELAKVFTGLSGSERLDGQSVIFTTSIAAIDVTKPMAMFESFHDKSSKTMIDGTILPANQPGMDDVNYAIEMLFNHNNVAPFISYRLIQQLVKSNPTPQYINRVATIFNNNGNGVRGDLGAVVKAILMDEEARDCTWIDNITSGKFLQPIERFTTLFKAFNVSTTSGKFYLRDLYEYGIDLEQSMLEAPTVFNYFSPFYAENGLVEENNLVSPEFEIFTSTTSIHYLNIIEDAIKYRPFANRTTINPNGNENVGTNDYDEPYYNFQTLIDIYNNNGVNALIDRLNLILCSNNLKNAAKNIIANTITQYQTDVAAYDAELAVKDAIYFIVSTPSFTILK